jgi:hydroxyacylglutathione hydrolase
MKIQSFVVSPLRSNCYVLAESDTAGAKAVIIDPGDRQLEPVLTYIKDHGLDLQAVWATHAHVDHVMGVDVIRQTFGVPAYVHSADSALWSNMHRDARDWIGANVAALAPPDAFIEEGQVLSCGDLSFTVQHTPGHSPGSVCLVGDSVVFTGDTLFANGVGRTDLPGGSFAELNQSLKRLLELPNELEIYPGHMGSSTIGLERRINPFLQNLED